jgi:hypothetical protein
MNPGVPDRESMSDHDLLIGLDVKLDNLLVCQKDHEDRIRSLESDRGKILGFAGALGFVGGMFFPVFEFFKKVG